MQFKKKFREKHVYGFKFQILDKTDKQEEVK